ncbi:hypothetical protein [Heyndrickxia shackletonii]|nr:hypothetical protein [Heyndrickxia shackletonii]
MEKIKNKIRISIKKILFTCNEVVPFPLLIANGINILRMGQ